MKTTIKPKYPVVWVVWDDAEGEAGWSEEPVAPLEATLATTIGFLIRDEEKYVLIADSYFAGSKTVGGTNKIPRGMIVRMEEVTLSRKKKKSDKTKATETPEAQQG